MSDFTNKLYHDHELLLEKLELCRKGPGVTGTAWKESFFEARDIFLAHLKTEDENLYPALVKAAAKDPTLQKIAEKYADGMKAVSAKVLAFFKKYTETSQGSDFIRDFAEMQLLLKERIAQEEKELYVEYDKAVGK